MLASRAQQYQHGQRSTSAGSDHEANRRTKNSAPGAVNACAALGRRGVLRASCTSGCDGAAKLEANQQEGELTDMNSRSTSVHLMVQADAADSR